MRRIINSYMLAWVFLALGVLVSCASEEAEKEPTLEEKYPVEEGQRLKYNNEYLKVIDDDEADQQPKRLINENAVMNLGELHISWGEDSKKVTAFRKGGTDLHFSKKGVRLRIQDMYDLSILMQIQHERDPFAVAGNQFSIGDRANNSLALTFKDEWEIGELSLLWQEGKMDIQQLKASTGEVELGFSGKATNELTQETRPFTMRLKMRMEEITSSVRPEIN